MKTKRTVFLLVQDCQSKSYESDSQALIREVAAFNTATLCSRCSGGIANGAIYQVFHPSAHLSAKSIVNALTP